MSQSEEAIVTEPDSFWDILIQLIEEEKVVPITGPDLLVIDTPSSKTSLCAYFAEQLAHRIGVSTQDLPVGGELNEVACRFLAQGNQVEDIYPALRAITAKADTFPIPKPLLQLADIRPLKLFVTTTFDSFLSKALDQQRFSGNVKTSIYTYSPHEVQDVPRDLRGAGVPIVYHLLGRVSSTPAYAVTQEDMVEFMHSLHSETHRPSLLFDELNRKSLLLLGNRFTGWLVRFFLRMAKSGRLSSGGKSDYVADPAISNDTNQVLFLKSFSRTTKIYRSGGAVDFVAELHRRWVERHPTPVQPIPGPPDSSDMERGAVFLSYASGDMETVEKIKAALEAAGVDVWFDRDQLQGGDAWDTKIRRNIKGCSLFVPVISKRTLTPDRRYFRVEWNLALAEAQKASFSDQEAFLFPVVIDDTKQNDPSLPEKFQSIQWTPLPDGEPSPAFITRVQQLFRKYQKSQLGTP
jgi:hypothetical protein